MLTLEIVVVAVFVAVVESVMVEAVEVLTSLDPIQDGTEQTLVFTVGHTGRATIPAILAHTATHVIRPQLHLNRTDVVFTVNQ